ncbi:hypothetical protein GDO86_009695, partial [Hymenochirus boettgeri]
MIYTIEKINNSTLLPGIKLGYEIYDSCSDVSKAVQSTFKLFPELNTLNNLTICNNTMVPPSVKAVIGESFSELSIAISRVLSLYSIPQISAVSSAPNLSDKLRFPSFLRTVPSDKHQARAIAKMIRKFQWNWVGIIYTDDDYGRSATELLNSYFEEEMICPAFYKNLPTYVTHPSIEEDINYIIGKLKDNSVNVVVIIAKWPIVIKLFQEAVRMNMSKTWIASDIWSTSTEVLKMDNIGKVGTIIGLMFKAQPVFGLVEFLQNLYPPDNGAMNVFLEEYKQLHFGCYKKDEYLECDNSYSLNCSLSNLIIEKSPLACMIKNVSLANDNYLVQNIDWSTPYRTGLAVTAIAQSLHNILCRNGTCVKDLYFSPSELLKEIRRVNFSFNSKMYSFDKDGDFLSGYDIINWHTKGKYPEFKAVGEYNIIPFSNCSKPCLPGYYKKHSLISCCYQCVPCPEGYFSSGIDVDECTKCNQRQWSNNGSSRCEEKKTEFFHWNNPFAIVLMSFAVFAFLLILVIGILFIKHNDTSAVKASGGNYSYLMTVSLSLCLVSTGFLIGQPSNVFCNIRQPLYGISFTICLSCILVQSLHIFLAFWSAQSGHLKNISSAQSVAIVFFLTGFQICVCILWLILKSPFVREIDIIAQILILQCDEGSYVAFGIMLGYHGFLSLMCFFLAYKGRKLQGRYNEARFITFSMLFFMLVWIIFIPIYINTSYMYQSAVQVVAILASIYGVIACQFLPACYIILFKQKHMKSEKNMN